MHLLLPYDEQGDDGHSPGTPAVHAGRGLQHYLTAVTDPLSDEGQNYYQNKFIFGGFSVILTKNAEKPPYSVHRRKKRLLFYGILIKF